MLAKYSIRTKITAVVAFLLVAMSLMGALNIRQMYAINSSTTDITTNWLPSIRVLGELQVVGTEAGIDECVLAALRRIHRKLTLR